MKVIPRYAYWASLLLVFAITVAACKGNQTATNPAATQDQAQQDPSQDPAMANVAPISNATSPAPAPSSGGYDQSAPAPSSPPPPARRPERREQDRNSADQAGQYPSDQADQSDQGGGQYSNSDYDSYDKPVAYAQQPPPPLPEYEQPMC